MSDLSSYTTDLAKYTAAVDEAAVAAIVKYCGIALRNADSSMVATSDPKELATVRDGFAAKKLGLSADAAATALKTVADKLKGVRSKGRVTVYYLLAEATGTLDKLR